MKKYKFFVGGDSKRLTDTYVSSLEFDKIIVKYVSMVMLVHVRELARRKILKEEIAKNIINELVDIIESNGEKLYSWIKNRDDVYEDVFEALEVYLYNVVGPDAGYIAIGRSRNDHIAAVLRLLLRDKLIEVLTKILEIRKTLIDKASKYKDTIFPFFTHGQVAQCGSAALYFVSYEKTFSDLWLLLLHSINTLNQNPLGSGAAAGTFVQLDTYKLSEELCFSKDPIPPYYATGSRLFLLHILSLLSLMMVEISRFAEDMMLLVNVIRQGIDIPRHHISTSSIMPHKRNIVTLEIARAKASNVIGVLTSLLTTYKSLPYGYNLDFQEMNLQILNALKDVVDTLEVVKDFIDGLELRDDKIMASLSNTYCWSSDLIEYIAINTGKPVRELYIELAKAIQSSMLGYSDQLKNFLIKYGISDANVWELHRLKPIEKSIDETLSRMEKDIQNDFERVKRLNNDLIRCNEMLIRRTLEV